MTNEEVARRFDSVWDGRAELLPPRAQHAPVWWDERTKTRLEQRDGRVRGMGRAHRNYDWPVKDRAFALIRAGQSVRQAADAVGVPYFTVRNWMRFRGREGGRTSDR